jgi:hypothetical protein
MGFSLRQRYEYLKELKFLIATVQRVHNPQTLASIFILALRYGGKVHEFVVYLERNSFDTPENRVITSGLTFGFGLHKLLGHSTHQRRAFYLANKVIVVQ